MKKIGGDRHIIIIGWAALTIIPHPYVRTITIAYIPLQPLL